jgi:hypothetical protein
MGLYQDTLALEVDLGALKVDLEVPMGFWPGCLTPVCTISIIMLCVR